MEVIDTAYSGCMKDFNTVACVVVVVDVAIVEDNVVEDTVAIVEDTVVEDMVVVGAIVDDTFVDLKITFELTSEPFIVIKMVCYNDKIKSILIKKLGLITIDLSSRLLLSNLRYNKKLAS